MHQRGGAARRGAVVAHQDGDLVVRALLVIKGHPADQLPWGAQSSVREDATCTRILALRTPSRPMPRKENQIQSSKSTTSKSTFFRNLAPLLNEFSSFFCHLQFVILYISNYLPWTIWTKECMKLFITISQNICIVSIMTSQITSCFTNHILHSLAQNCLLDYVPHVSSHKLRHKIVNASTYYKGPSPTAEFHQELISSLSLKIWICEKVIMKKLLRNIAISKIFFFLPSSSKWNDYVKNKKWNQEQKNSYLEKLLNWWS